MQDKNPLAHYSGVLSEAVQESAAEHKPLFYVSRQQIDGFTLLKGLYIPFRREPEGLFQMAVYAAPVQAARPIEVTDGMAMTFHHAITDGAIGQDDLNEIKVGLQAVLANVTALQAAPTAVAVPDGYAMVPLRLTTAMDEVLRTEGWQWEDLLAAAESITKQQYAALAATPAAAQTHAEAAAALCINSALTRIRAGNHAEAIAPLEHALRALADTPAAPVAEDIRHRNGVRKLQAASASQARKDGVDAGDALYALAVKHGASKAEAAGFAHHINGAFALLEGQVHDGLSRETAWDSAAQAATPAAAPILISSLQSILADADVGPPTDSQWCCKECGRWTPWHHPEAHDHEEGCTAPSEYAKRRDWKSRLSTLIAATPAAAAPVVLPEPWGYLVEGRIFIGRLLPQHVNSMVESEGFRPIKLFTEQQLRALLATGGKAQAVEVDDSMALAFHHAITDGAIGQDDLNEIKIGLRAALVNLHSPQAQAGEQAPALYVSKGQLCNHRDPEGPDSANAGRYLPARITPAGKFTTPLFAAPQAQADAREAQLLAFAVSEIRSDEMTDSALLDAMEQNRIAVVPEYEGPWDAEVYNDEGKPNHRGSGSTPREAIRAAIAAAKGE